MSQKKGRIRAPRVGVGMMQVVLIARIVAARTSYLWQASVKHKTKGANFSQGLCLKIKISTSPALMHHGYQKGYLG
jgi:hypothetical protein